MLAYGYAGLANLIYGETKFLRKILEVVEDIKRAIMHFGIP